MSLSVHRYCSPVDTWKIQLSFPCLKNMTSRHIPICKKHLLWSVTFLQKVSSPTYLGSRCGRQENASGEWSEGIQIPLWWDFSQRWSECCARSTAPRFLYSFIPITSVFSLQQGIGLYVHLALRSSGWETINLDISLHWSILRFTHAGKFFLCKQAELIEPVEWASLNGFLLSSVSSSDAFWCATHLALSAGEVTKVKWRWEHFIHNCYELFRPTVSSPLGNICFLIAV